MNQVRFLVFSKNNPFIVLYLHIFQYRFGMTWWKFLDAGYVLTRLKQYHQWIFKNSELAQYLRAFSGCFSKMSTLWTVQLSFENSILKDSQWCHNERQWVDLLNSINGGSMVDTHRYSCPTEEIVFQVALL